MNNEYYWWDLENSRFKAVLYDSINCYFLHDLPYQNWQEFSEADPHMAYAHLTYVRFNMLEQQFIDLRVIPQMLGVETVPVKSSVQDINRYDWLKSVVDLTLFRFSSLRDIAFHFVNEVLELGLSDFQLNIKQLKKALKTQHPEILEDLIVLDKTGEELRTDRNERAHKGFSELYTGDDQMFKNMSWMEGKVIDNTGYDLVGIYESSRDKISELVVQEVQVALKATINLVDNCYAHYRDTHLRLSRGSAMGVSQHFPLHCEKDS
ncbi:Cthe_2314 family HEPN domain-containing protein [Shewanella sp. Shew256]|uniref:Cthe_2314 family HEPN domain-containing protein n=1 Tax=Shewanella sp. Shew256 TaxID=1969376 RepID=UPI000B4A1638|nr:Cthe_2314 family HEPN domain-containing protein [Shewanella sp. Shew256]